MEADTAVTRSIIACNRCRKRKTRCDTGRPACDPCQRIGAACEYTDPRTKRIISRQYICELERKIKDFESSIQGPSPGTDHSGPTPADSNASAQQEYPGRRRESAATSVQPDLITVEDNHRDPSFLGVSSGYHLARSLLNLTGSDPITFRPRLTGVLPRTALETPPALRAIPESFIAPSSKYSPAYLTDLYFTQCQLQYPILEEDEFYHAVDKLQETRDRSGLSTVQTKTRFLLYMVLSIASILLAVEDNSCLSHADYYNACAFKDFSKIMAEKDLGTLQCILMLLLYSLSNPLRAPVWHISGVAIRMCIDLGLYSERTIWMPLSEATDACEADRRSRLFWVTYTIDRVLAISLGRPMWPVAIKGDVLVPYPELTLPEGRRNQVVHWFQLHRLQSEIISRLYPAGSMGHSPYAEDFSFFIEDMQRRLDDWKTEGEALLITETVSLDWIYYSYHNAVLLLNRPAPRNPSPSTSSLLSCYTAACAVIQISFIRQREAVVDQTWISAHSQFMAGISLLFTLWNCQEARTKAVAGWLTVKSCLVQCESVLEGMQKRWPSIRGSREVLSRLSKITVEAIESETRLKLPMHTTAQGVDIALPAPSLDQSWHDQFTSIGAASSMDPLESSQTNNIEPPSFSFLPAESLEIYDLFGQDFTRNLFVDPIGGPPGLDWESLSMDPFEYQMNSVLNFQSNG